MNAQVKEVSAILKGIAAKEAASVVVPYSVIESIDALYVSDIADLCKEVAASLIIASNKNMKVKQALARQLRSYMQEVNAFRSFGYDDARISNYLDMLN